MSEDDRGRNSDDDDQRRPAVHDDGGDAGIAFSEPPGMKWLAIRGPFGGTGRMKPKNGTMQR
jgi:hypothetical protein